MNLSIYRWGVGSDQRGTAFWGWAEAIFPKGFVPRLLAERGVAKSVSSTSMGIINGNMPRLTIGRFPDIFKNVNEDKPPSKNIRQAAKAKETGNKVKIKVSRSVEKNKAAGMIEVRRIDKNGTARAGAVKEKEKGKLLK